MNLMSETCQGHIGGPGQILDMNRLRWQRSIAIAKIDNRIRELEAEVQALRQQIYEIDNVVLAMAEKRTIAG